MEEAEKQRLTGELQTFCKDLRRYKARILRRRKTTYTESQERSLDVLRQSLQRKHGQLGDIISEYAGSAYIPIPILGRQLEVFSHGLSSIAMDSRGIEALDAAMQLVNKTIGRLEAPTAKSELSDIGSAGAAKAAEDRQGRIVDDRFEFIAQGTPDMILESINNVVNTLNSQGHDYGFHRIGDAPDWATWDKTYVAGCTISQGSEKKIGTFHLQLIPNEKTLLKLPHPDHWDPSFKHFLDSLFAEFQTLGFVESREEKAAGDVMAVKAATQQPSTFTEGDLRKVFVVHGRNEEAREAMFTFLRSIGLDPIEWLEAIKLTNKASPYIGEVLDMAFSYARAIVVVLTGDDLARLGTRFTAQGKPDESFTPQARPNVIFESGLALGRNPERTVIVQLGELRDISDLAGRHVVRMDNTVAQRQALASRLKSAGCNVQIENRTDWHSAGDFSSAITSPDK